MTSYHSFYFRCLYLQQLSETDCVSNICSECCKFMTKIEEYSERCMKVNLLYNSLISTSDLPLDPNYLQNLRYEAGLDKDEVIAENDTLIKVK